MSDLVIYKQSLTILTGQWNIPRRKVDNGWRKIERTKLVRDRHDGSFRGAIIRMKNKLEKMRNKNHHPIWKCRMTTQKTGGYRVYYLTCKRITHN